MQGLGYRQPAFMQEGIAAPRGQPQACKILTEGSASLVLMPISKPDLGTPIRVPVSMHGQRLCPTPKSARPTPKPPQSYSLPMQGTVNTIQSPELKGTGDSCARALYAPIIMQEDQRARRVLIDSNGQRKEETPRISKIFTTPRMQQHSDNCHGTMTPRALFPLHEDVAPSSAGRVAQEVPCSDLVMTPALCVKGPATQGYIKETHKIIGEKSVQKTGARKRARDEVNGAKLDGSLITTRSKTKWTKTGFFSTSSAVRVTVGNHNQKDITRTPRSAINHQPERKSKGNTTPAEKQTKQEEGDLKKLEDSTNIKESLKPLDLAKKVWGLGSPAIRVRVHSPGHRSLLRSPLVTPSAQSTDRRKLVHSQGSAKQASARKNLARMLLVEK